MLFHFVIISESGNKPHPMNFKEDMIMRKTAKFLAAAAAAAVTLTVSAVPAVTYAEDNETAVTSYAAEAKDDFDNDYYKEYIKEEFWEQPYEEEVLEYLNSAYKIIDGHWYFSSWDSERPIIHVYEFGWGKAFEYEPEKGTRTFIQAFYYYPESVDIVGDADKAIEHIKAFLKDNSINVEVEVSDDKKSFSIKFDESNNEGEKAKTYTEIIRNGEYYHVKPIILDNYLGIPFPTFCEGADYDEYNIRNVYGSEDYPSYKAEINNPAYEKHLGRYIGDGTRYEKYELTKDKELYALVNKCNRESGKIPRSEDDTKPFGGRVVNIYYDKDKRIQDDRLLLLEYEMPDGTRTLVYSCDLGMREFHCWNDSANDIYTYDQLNEFAKKHGYDIKFKMSVYMKTAEDYLAYQHPQNVTFSVTYDEKYSLADILKISLAMRDELGIEDPILTGYNASWYFRDGEDYGFSASGKRMYLDGSAGDEMEDTDFGEFEVPIETTATFRGDADLNGEVSLSDVIVVAKYNLSNEAYPLKNETAEANADMNSDGKVDGLDTSALIEINLG